MIDALHAMHYKVVLHTVIEGRHLTGTVTDPCARRRAERPRCGRPLAR